MKQSNKWGFTLIELLVVVLIIGVLAAVALPQYQKAVEKSRYVEARQTISLLENAIELYLLENGFPIKATSFLTGEEYVYDERLEKIDNLAIELPCSFTEEGYCMLENFMYILGCRPDRKCEIESRRLNDNYYPVLFSLYDAQMGKWTRICGYNDPLGKAGCEYLENSGGWQALEGYDI